MSTPTHPPRKTPAFTLIELLVVVAIITLIMSILIPSLNQARQQALRTRCGANLHTWGQGLYSYSAEYGGRIPRSWSFGNTCSCYWLSQTTAASYGSTNYGNSKLFTGEISVDIMLPYTGGVDPSTYKTYLTTLTGPWTPVPMRGSWICPAAVSTTATAYAGQFQNAATHIHYQYFGMSASWQDTGNGIDYAKSPYTTRPQDLVDRLNNASAQQLLMSDMVFCQGGLWMYNHSANTPHPVWTNSSNGQAYPANTATGASGINQLFADGHVIWRPFTLAETTKMDAVAAAGFTDTTTPRVNHNFY